MIKNIQTVFSAFFIILALIMTGADLDNIYSSIAIMCGMMMVISTPFQETKQIYKMKKEERRASQFKVRHSKNRRDAGGKKLAWAFGIVGGIGGACGGVVAGAGAGSGSAVPGIGTVAGGILGGIGGASAGFTAGFASGRAY